MFRKSLILFIFLLLAVHSVAADLQSIRLILKWDHQYQFSGYYAAQWQGYYADEGLDVSFIARPQKDGTFLNLKKEMNEGRAEFAVGGPTILKDNDDGSEFVLISSLYQRSPFSFVVMKDSPIKRLSDFTSACIESSQDFGELEFKSLMHMEGLSTNSINWKKFNFGLKGIANNNCDMVIDYGISARWASKEKNISIREFKSEQFGLNYYGDILYTSKQLADSDPDLVEKFRRASMKGWVYALENPSEVSEGISKRLSKVFNYKDNYAYNMMSYASIKLLMNYPMVEVGHSNLDRWGKIQKYLYEIGEVEDKELPSWFLFDYEKYQAENNRVLILLILSLFILLSVIYFVFYFKSKRKYEKNINEKTVLIENQYLLSAVIDLLPMNIYWKDKDSNYLGSNRSFSVEAGIDPDIGVKGKNDFDLSWASMATEVIEDDMKVLNGSKTTESYEKNWVKKDGTVEWLKIRKVPIKNKNNEILGVLGAYQSITEFKNALKVIEDQKKSSENLLDRFKGLINSSPDMIFYKSYTGDIGRYLICNGLFEEWVGLNEKQIVNLTDFDLFDESLADQYKRDDLFVITSRKEQSKEMLIKTASGRQVLYDFLTIPVVSNGDVDGVMCLGRDITKKRELESIYEAIFTVTEDAYFILSDNGSIVNCNSKALEFLGMDHKANLVGLKLIRDFSPEYQPDGRRSIDVSKEVNECLMQSKDGYYSATFQHQDIDSKPLHVDVFLAQIGNDRILVQWHDISKSKEKQEQLELAKKEAEELAKTKSLFLANMSHEIRTPLNAIVGLGGLLEKTTDKDKSKLFIESINQSSKHLLGVVNDILEYSKLEADKMTFELMPVDVGLTLKEVVELYKGQADQSNVEIEILPSSKVGYVMSDPTKLKQIVSNLVSNAIKFSKGGRVTIFEKVEMDQLFISVEDTGIGISPDSVENLFTPFSQEDISTTRKYGGTGLGLSICKGLANLLGGAINVKSQLGVGTTFTLTLPFVKPEKQVESESLITVPDLSGKSILIAEDNALNQLVIKEILLDTHASIAVVDDGLKAFEILEEQVFDLILMDIQMPILDGINATKRIRKELELNTPVIALTANSGEEEKERALASGMNDFLSKPIDQKRLFNILIHWAEKT